MFNDQLFVTYCFFFFFFFVCSGNQRKNRKRAVSGAHIKRMRAASDVVGPSKRRTAAVISGKFKNNTNTDDDLHVTNESANDIHVEKNGVKGGRKVLQELVGHISIPLFVSEIWIV